MRKSTTNLYLHTKQLRSSRVVATLIALLLFTGAFSQLDWTWVNGPSNTVNQGPTYGTMGTGASTNSPGGRFGYQSWTDNNGVFWIFSDGSNRNDLWKYTRSNNQWTWVRGSNVANASGSPGTQGVPSSSNDPDLRTGAVTWVDGNNDLWMFGGYNNANGYLNDLWRYNISNNQWTWMKGSATFNSGGTYGTQGTGAAPNTPGGREEASGWYDGNGNLWLFGGLGFPANTNTGYLNDLWKYNISNNQWTWVKGPNTSNGAGTWGTQGTAAAGNIPPGKYECVAWTSNAGDLFLFGGQTAFQYNDLWKYNISSNNWTWIKGSSTGNALASYGTINTAAASNVPGSRYSAVGWKDSNGDFLLFGGAGQTASSYNVLLSDMWKYTVSTNNWTWLDGPSTGNNTGTYGTLGLAAAANNPGGRIAPAAFGGGAIGFWLYGGSGNASSNQGALSDLWKYDACSVAAPSNSTSAANSTACAGSTVTLSAANGTFTVQWFNSSTSTVVIGTGTNFPTPVLSAVGNMSVNTFYAGSFGCAPSASRTAISVSVNPLPVIGVNSGNMCSGKSFTINATGAVSYTYPSNSPIVSPASSTNYTVYGISSLNCVGQGIVNVNVIPSPTLNISATSTVICKNDPSTITVTGANASYLWNTGDNGSIIVVNPTVSTTYSVTGTNSNGCVNSTTVNINVGSAAVNIIATPSLICDGQTATLTASGAGTYLWSTNSSSPQIVVTPAVTTNYSISGMSSGCTATAALLLVVDALPLATVQKPETLCTGQSGTLMAYGANAYSWNGAGNSPSIVITPTTTTVYTVVATSLNGCSKTATLSTSVTECTELTELSSEKPNVYPNPSTGIFTINLSGITDNIIVTVTDLSGRLIMKLTPQTNDVIFDLSNSQAGVYLVRITAGSAAVPFQHRLIKMD